mmetsp:Transcript_25451/g.66630  ORF Transcript_25451/g.66630 Transcript_25451/m.66630 type:complete len:305 (-) Transcript_25451:1105-2019(-)
MVASTRPTGFALGRQKYQAFYMHEGLRLHRRMHLHLRTCAVVERRTLNCWSRRIPHAVTRQWRLFPCWNLPSRWTPNATLYHPLRSTSLNQRASLNLCRTYCPAPCARNARRRSGIQPPLVPSLLQGCAPPRWRCSSQRSQGCLDGCVGHPISVKVSPASWAPGPVEPLRNASSAPSVPREIGTPSFQYDGRLTRIEDLPLSAPSSTCQASGWANLQEHPVLLVFPGVLAVPAAGKGEVDSSGRSGATTPSHMETLQIRRKSLLAAAVERPPTPKTPPPGFFELLARVVGKSGLRSSLLHDPLL